MRSNLGRMISKQPTRDLQSKRDGLRFLSLPDLLLGCFWDADCPLDALTAARSGSLYFKWTCRYGRCSLSKSSAVEQAGVSMGQETFRTECSTQLIHSRSTGCLSSSCLYVSRLPNRLRGILLWPVRPSPLGNRRFKFSTSQREPNRSIFGTRWMFVSKFGRAGPVLVS